MTSAKFVIEGILASTSAIFSILATFSPEMPFFTSDVPFARLAIIFVDVWLANSLYGKLLSNPFAWVYTT